MALDFIFSHDRPARLSAQGSAAAGATLKAAVKRMEPGGERDSVRAASAALRLA